MLEQLGATSGGGSNHPAYKIRKQRRIGTAVHKGSDHETVQQADLSRVTNDNIIATVVKGKPEKMMRIVNIYEQQNMQTWVIPVRKADWYKDIRQEASTILVGDNNVHSR